MGVYPPRFCEVNRMARKWVSSANGPDWTDVRTGMRGIQDTHRCSCYLEMFPGFTRYGPELRLVLTAVSLLPGTQLHVCEESVATTWPRGWSEDMASTVFALLYRLENVLTSRWWQGETYQLP